MNLNKLKKTLTISALGLAVLFGAGESANAQSRKQIQKQQQKVAKQRQKAAKENQKLAQQQKKLQNMRYRVYRDGKYYQTDQRGADLLRQAVNRGYQEGFRAGQNDRSNRRGSNYYNNSVYRNGNYGYQSHVDSRQYQYYFQQGFQRGYQDGYNSRYQYGTNSGGSLNILGSILQGILNLQQF
jgi:flagellar biosynthesis/type III secretory pathway protein FliH